MIRLALALFAALWPAGFALAEPVKLDGPEIKTLLSGNTVHGTWAGKEYWSFFGADGATTRLTADGMRADGFWKVSGTQYCVDWPTGLATVCYDLYRDGETILWGEPLSGARYPSTLLTGNQVPK